MKTNHSKGKWTMNSNVGTSDPDKTGYYVTDWDGYIIAEVLSYNNTKPAKGNAELIANAPELLQMVYDLMKCVHRLANDDMTQYEKDKEAQWEGEAHELLLKINPDYYRNANEKETINS